MNYDVIFRFLKCYEGCDLVSLVMSNYDYDREEAEDVVRRFYDSLND